VNARRVRRPGGTAGAGGTGSSDHSRRRTDHRRAVPIPYGDVVVSRGGKWVTRTPSPHLRPCPPGRSRCARSRIVQASDGPSQALWACSSRGAGIVSRPACYPHERMAESLAPATGGGVRRSMSAKIRYTGEPLGRLKVVRDFLPPPEDLVFRDEGVNVTIALSKRSVEFFKGEARKHNTQYQRMIRRLLDAYAEHHSPRPSTRSTRRRAGTVRAG